MQFWWPKTLNSLEIGCTEIEGVKINKHRPDWFLVQLFVNGCAKEDDADDGKWRNMCGESLVMRQDYIATCHPRQTT